MPGCGCWNRLRFRRIGNDSRFLGFPRFRTANRDLVPSGLGPVGTNPRSPSENALGTRERATGCGHARKRAVSGCARRARTAFAARSRPKTVESARRFERRSRGPRSGHGAPRDRRRAGTRPPRSLASAHRAVFRPAAHAGPGCARTCAGAGSAPRASVRVRRAAARHPLTKCATFAGIRAELPQFRPKTSADSSGRTVSARGRRRRSKRPRHTDPVGNGGLGDGSDAGGRRRIPVGPERCRSGSARGFAEARLGARLLSRSGQLRRL